MRRQRMNMQYTKALTMKCWQIRRIQLEIPIICVILQQPIPIQTQAILKIMFLCRCINIEKNKVKRRTPRTIPKQQTMEMNQWIPTIEATWKAVKRCQKIRLRRAMLAPRTMVVVWGSQMIFLRRASVHGRARRKRRKKKRWLMQTQSWRQPIEIRCTYWTIARETW